MERKLSKSRYLAGLQCHRYLWLLFNDPGSIPSHDEVTEFIFKQGHEVGQLAKTLFPGGFDLEPKDYTKGSIEEAIEKTKEHIDDGRVLFEPSFSYKNTFCMPDILIPISEGSWDIIEVKSSTSKKEVNTHDLSFQKYCLEGFGLKIRRCFLMYINKDYIRSGDIVPEDFFVKEDVTGDIELLMPGMKKRIDEMMDVINGPCPDMKIGNGCFNPYECPLKDECWSILPKDNVFELYRGKALGAGLYEKGIKVISDIKDLSGLNKIQLMQYYCVKSQSRFVDNKNIKAFMGKLRFPIYLLDFETFATAIPLFDGIRPYQNIPFQFSCHIFNDLDLLERHLFFLNEEELDPRKGLLVDLKHALGYQGNDHPEGSIIVYYEYFEKLILKELAKAFPEEAHWIQDAMSRIVDLYEPFGKFYFYHPVQKGSASLKNVLPAITQRLPKEIKERLDYDGLRINNGQQASIKYLSNCLLKDDNRVPKTLRDKTRQDLIDYCGLDTEGMIYILRELNELA